MKRNLKKGLIGLLCVIVLLSTVTSVIAATIFTENGYTVKVDDDGYTRLSSWAFEGMLRVPSVVMNHYINEIENYAFLNNNNVTGLDLQDFKALRRIGLYAFYGSGLSGELVIPNSVTEIGNSAFEQSAISSIVLYSGSKTIPEQMCYFCSNLTDVTINYGFRSIGRLAFARCEKLQSVKINTTVTEIDDTAFYNCPNLIIYCYTGSYAHQYAEDKGIDYVLIDAPEPTEPPTEPPTDAPTDAPTEKGYYILGDVNDDDIAESLDATIILRYNASMRVPFTLEQLMHGDVDGDEDISVIDATLILRNAAGMQTKFLIGELVTK